MLSGNMYIGSPPYNYIWTSSLDGFIGNTSKILTFSLTRGTHTITLTVTDAAGLTNSTSAIISINPTNTINASGQSRNVDNVITFSQSSSISIVDGLRLHVNSTPSLVYYPEMTVISRPDPFTIYDSNSDGRIDKSEAILAVRDYFSGAITKQEAIAVVMAYFSS